MVCLVQGCEGRVVSCPLCTSGNYFVKWNKPGNIFKVMEAPLERMLSAGTLPNQSTLVADGMNDMLAFYRRYTSLAAVYYKSRRIRRFNC